MLLVHDVFFGVGIYLWGSVDSKVHDTHRRVA